ncbi:MAG: class I SAM-dependent methyltransferase [Verrucomicrobiota bacterium]
MPQKSRLKTAVAMAHQLVKECISSGDTAIDATLGNGHDALFLANQVGAEGKVIGLDIQSVAVEASRVRLKAHPQVELHCLGHENLGHFAGSAPRVIMFNLGYCPGADKSIITLPSTTVPALQAASELLAPGGLLTIAVYTGHEGGPAEGDAVTQWAAGLCQDQFAVAQYQFLNQKNCPPYLVAVERKG